VPLNCPAWFRIFFGVSARRILKALARGRPTQRFGRPWPIRSCVPRSTVVDALGRLHRLQPIYRRLLKMFLEELQLIDQQMRPAGQELASLLSRHRMRRALGRGAWSRRRLSNSRSFAEVGAKALTFPSAKKLSSWVGASRETRERGGIQEPRSPKATATMRRVLNQAANAAASRKGPFSRLSIATSVASGHINHRGDRTSALSSDLDNSAPGVRYAERGPSVNAKSRRRRTHKMIRELRSLGYRVEPVGTPA